MPSRRKTLMFASAFFTSLCSFVIVCIVLATKNWVSSDITNLKENPNMKLKITYGLFQGVCSDVSPGISLPHSSFQVADTLGNYILKIFHGVIIFLLVVTMLSSFLSSGFTCYNAISNPYQTFLGPIGVYTWNSVSCICCLLNLILFAVNVEVNKLSAELAIKYCKVSKGVEQSNSYGYSYWIMLLIIALNATTVIIIVFYQRAKYSKKKERERPLDSAPKDGILF
ncbi:clarin-3 [Ahaetulla prasina]|uniref:clarin-3 n=1 Tax=Ahaetulla prasina TaxID=499056 RepID=UPI00264965C3|nr:clarin-3 [Ahaetulla prasina]